MNRNIITYFIICLLTALSPIGMRAANNQAMISSAKLTNHQIVMGDTTTIRLEIVQNKGERLMAGLEVKDSISSAVEIGELIACDTTDLGNNRWQINATYIVQAFDSGEWHINPVLLLEADTIRCDIPLVIRVSPVKVDPNGNIKDFAPVLEPERQWLDYVPMWATDLWWLWALLVMAALALVAYFKWWRKGKNPLKRSKKRQPPHEEAMSRLRWLKQQQLWEKGRDKDYYTALTDILREYIDRRFSINAVEMTSSEIMEALKHNSETRLVNENLNEILRIADFVKFANQRPLADDNELSFRYAMNFIDATKPLPQPESKPKEKEDKK